MIEFDMDEGPPIVGDSVKNSAEDVKTTENVKDQNTNNQDEQPKRKQVQRRTRRAKGKITRSKSVLEEIRESPEFWLNRRKR